MSTGDIFGDTETESCNMKKISSIFDIHNLWSFIHQGCHYVADPQKVMVGSPLTNSCLCNNNIVYVVLAIAQVSLSSI